jgi:hypothetical protein
MPVLEDWGTVGVLLGLIFRVSTSLELDASNLPGSNAKSTGMVLAQTLLRVWP